MSDNTYTQNRKALSEIHDVSAQGLFEEGSDPLDVNYDEDETYEQDTMADVSHTPKYGDPCPL